MFNIALSILKVLFRNGEFMIEVIQQIIAEVKLNSSPNQSIAECDELLEEEEE